MGAYGSVNGIYGDHTLWDAARRVGFQLCFDVDHDDLQPDILNCRYLVSFGSSPLEAGNPMQAVARKTVRARFGPEGGIEAMQDDDYRTRYAGRYGGLQWVVIDPRLSESASKAQTWLSIKPGGYAALAFGMIRRLLETGAYRRGWLENTCRRAAHRDHESAWSDATYLVRLDTMTFMRPEGGGEDQYMVFDGTGIVPYDSVDHGVLETGVSVGGVPCKTVFTLLKERVYARAMSQYADFCGVDVREIEKIADLFAEYAPRAVAELGETAASHVNGSDAARAVTFLNLLAGNLNRKGGLIVGGGWDPVAKRRLLASMEEVPAGREKTGIGIDRAGVNYEETGEYREHGFPARRQWFPFVRTFGNVPEVLPSIAQGYPYPVDAVILYHTDPVYEVPGIRELAEETLQDQGKIPLLVAIDTHITESARFADYLLPDTTYLERWDICEVGAAIPTGVLGLRRPVVGYLDEKKGAYVPIYPQTRVMEDIFIDIAKRCNLPGFGKDALGKDEHLECAYHFYRRMAVAAVSSISDGGVTRGHEKDSWNVVTSRGGFFESYGRAYVGDQAAYRYEGLCHFYAEELAGTKNALTGRPYDPLPNPEGVAIGESEDFPLQVTSYRLAHQSMMRTAENRWILEVLPENYVLISPSDARRVGVRDGDTVKVESVHGAVKGRAVVRHGVRPGVIGVPYGYANRYLGAQSVKVDGALTGTDHTRGRGITILPIASSETGASRGCRQDPVSGNVAVNDTRVRLSKI